MHNLFFQGTYPVSPIVNVTLATMLNPADGSWFIGPNGSGAVFENWEGLGTVQVVRGGGEIELLVYLDAADRAGRDETPIQKLDKEGRWLLQKFEEFNVTKETIKPLIQGRDLIKMGVSPGPEMGKILKRIYQLQLDNEFETHAQGIKLVRQLIK